MINALPTLPTPPSLPNLPPEQQAPLTTTTPFVPGSFRSKNPFAFLRGFSRLSRKQVIGIVMLFFLVIGVASASMLSLVNQDIRNQASGGANLYSKKVCKADSDCGDKLKCLDTPYGKFCEEIKTAVEPEVAVVDFCGDNICGPTETVANCLVDCYNPTVEYGGVCSVNSDCIGPRECVSTFGEPFLCMNYSPGSVTCGDDVCENPENNTNCPNDCNQIGPDRVINENDVVDPIVGRECGYDAHCSQSTTCVFPDDVSILGTCRVRRTSVCELDSDCMPMHSCEVSNTRKICQPIFETNDDVPINSNNSQPPKPDQPVNVAQPTQESEPTLPIRSAVPEAAVTQPISPTRPISATAPVAAVSQPIGPAQPTTAVTTTPVVTTIAVTPTNPIVNQVEPAPIAVPNPEPEQTATPTVQNAEIEDELTESTAANPILRAAQTSFNSAVRAFLDFFGFLTL